MIIFITQPTAMYRHVQMGRETSEKRIPVEMYHMIEKVASLPELDKKTEVNVNFLMGSLMLPRHNLACLYLLMREFDDFMARHKILYWADGGTNLALARSFTGVTRQIPYDDDVDVCVFQPGYVKCMKHIKEMESLGYTVFVTPTMIKIATSHNWARSVSRTFGCVTLDIFCYKKANKKIRLADPAQRVAWPNAMYLCKEVFPVKRYQYGPVQFMGATSPEQYCDRLYPGWRETSVIELRDSPTMTQTNIKSDKISLPYEFAMKYAPDYGITKEELDETREKINETIVKTKDKFFSMLFNDEKDNTNIS
jgi:hypothetical protein